MSKDDTLEQRFKEALERKENESRTSKADVNVSNNKSNKADTKDIEGARTRIKDAKRKLIAAKSNPLGRWRLGSSATR